MPKTTNPFAKKKKGTTAAPFSHLQRIKPGIRTPTNDDDCGRLEDTGDVARLTPDGAPQDVISLCHYIRDHAFDEIPDRAAGMSSERIAEILQFRHALPPIVSIAHLHALSLNPTQTERQIAGLIADGRMRKVIIPGRGKGGDAIGEGLVVIEAWKTRIRETVGLRDDAKDVYVRLLPKNTGSYTTVTKDFGGDEIVRELISAGFITSPAALSAHGSGSLFSTLSTMSSFAVSKAGSLAATGTLAAIGGRGAIQEHGGGGSMLATKDTRPRVDLKASYMTFSMPGMGAYLKLLTEARSHMMHLLKQLSPRHKEATWDLLKEKWDGNVLNDPASRMKRARGEFTGVLPGKTKRWRDFYGLNFEWVLAECIGSGLMELFDTGSVGKAIRAR